LRASRTAQAQTTEPKDALEMGKQHLNAFAIAARAFECFGLGLSVPKTPSIGFAIAGESEHDCGCSQLPSFSSACCATASSRDDGLKSKSWCCGINSTSCSSARHVGSI
jgi:hypothetical protein